MGRTSKVGDNRIDSQNFLHDVRDQRSLVDMLIRTNLSHSNQIRHGIEVVHDEIFVTPSPNLSQRFRNFRPESFLNATLLGELPEGKRQLWDPVRWIGRAKTCRKADRFCRSVVARKHNGPATRMGTRHSNEILQMWPYRT